ncbi:unnamed protein product [Hydatigera taeniaeformis]|uniref:PKcGMP_CC domain-containing protein n=1 Tax=Hydatigena taeniaeformis TaxID=6205 RepID=A0A0R3WZ24_HYDTA|nr:unnamed protein product [Hydatigera taeniaeformis]
MGIISFFSPQADRESQLSGDGGNVEDMLLSMLDERDRLMVGLKEAREELQAAQLRLRDIEKERDILQTQLSNVVPTVSLVPFFHLYNQAFMNDHNSKFQTFQSPML